jgi:hypothetical protein
MVSFSWPSTPTEVLAWAEVVLVWTLANYFVIPDPAGREAIRQRFQEGRLLTWKRDLTRGVAVGVLTLVVVEWSSGSALLAAIGFGATVSLAWGRRLLVFKEMEWASQFEIVVNALMLGLAAWIVSCNHLESGSVLLSIPLSESRLAAIAVLASVFIFSGRGGTHIVRGILDKMGTVPRTSADAGAGEVDTDEYNRGEMIGNLERYLLVLTVVLGSYSALGFLVAAKGLIRIEEFKNRVFAEYFLIGTLSSVGIALVLGLLARWAILTLW